jgi:hypothetical protein
VLTEQAYEPVQEPQMAEYFVQNATGPVCPLECMPRLLIENVFLKSRMNQEVHVRFCEEQGVKIPLLTRLYAVAFQRYWCDCISTSPVNLKIITAITDAKTSKTHQTLFLVLLSTFLLF